MTGVGSEERGVLYNRLNVDKSALKPLNRIVTHNYWDICNQNRMLGLSFASPCVEYSVCVICFKYTTYTMSDEYGPMI